MNAPKWGDDPELFEAELRRGSAFAEIVARRFRDSGLPAVATPPRVARTRRDRRAFTIGDVDVVVMGSRGKQVIEVKSRRLRFTGPDDWPEDADPALIDTVLGWQAKAHKPAAVVLISQSTNGIAVAPRSSMPYWRMIRVNDHVREIPVTAYACPAEYLQSFAELTEWMKRETG